MSRRTSVFLLVVLALVACSPRMTRQAPAAKTSGFLGDYSRLQPGGPGRALLVYRAPDANLARYTFGVWADAVIGRLQAEGGPTRVLP